MTTNYMYRLFSKEGKLLYIGISVHPKIRFKQHALVQPWWREVCFSSIEEVGTRAEAEQAEFDAVQTELPVYNVAKRPVMLPVTPGSIQDAVGSCVSGFALEKLAQRLRRRREVHHPQA